LVRPNFFIIGAPKCGTTALAEYLRSHPNAFLCEPKEPLYFDLNLDPLYRMKEEDYLSLFAKADPRVHQAVGEASTSYLFSREAVPGILRFEPKARFIVMLRNPVELVQAAHSERLYQNWEDIPDFEEAWRADEDRRRGERLPPFCPNKKSAIYSDKGKLGDQMERLYSIVPRERVLVLLLEDLAADTRGCYLRVLTFLGLKDDGRTEFPRINENKSVRWFPLQRILSRLRKKAADLKGRWGLGHRNFGALSWLIQLNTGRKRRTDLPTGFQEELRAFYRDDVRKLSRIVGRDLSHWCD